MTEPAPQGRLARRRQAANRLSGGLAAASFALGVVALILSGCAALFVQLRPEAVSASPYALSAALALVAGFPGLVLGVVAWIRMHRAGSNVTMAIAGTILGLMAVAAGAGLASPEYLRWSGLL